MCGKQLTLNIPKNTEFYDQSIPAPGDVKLYKFFILSSGSLVVYTKDITYCFAGVWVRNKNSPSIKKEVQPEEVDRIRRDARWEMCSERSVEVASIRLNEQALPVKHNVWFEGIHDKETNKITFIKYIQS